MGEERTFACEYCGEPVTTRDPRKRFCNKSCADRSRGVQWKQDAATPGTGIIATLKGFTKLDVPARIRVLLGQEQFSIVHFDLECTSLKPNVGRIICASFLPQDGEDPYTFHAIERKFMRPDNQDDGALASAIRDELEKYDIIVGWNSKMFDLKFLNSRLLHAGERTKNPQHHVDGMWAWRSKASAWSGLAAAQQYIAPDGDEKTKIEWDQWVRVLGWNKELREAAMAEITHHCELDVRVLREVYTRIVKANVVRGLRRDGGIL